MSAPMADPAQEAEFQKALLVAVGLWSAVLPDYHKPDIMNVIVQCLPEEVKGHQQQRRLTER